MVLQIWPMLNTEKTITCLSLLAMLFLMQPRTWLAFFIVKAHLWLMFNLFSTRTPKSHSADLLSSHLAPSMCWQDLALLFVEHHDIPFCPVRQPVQVHLNGSKTSWHTVLGSNSSPFLCCLQIWWGCPVSHHQVINKEAEQYLSQYQSLGHTPITDSPPTELPAVMLFFSN